MPRKPPKPFNSSNIFPMKDGQPNPDFKALFDLSDPNNVTPWSVSANRKLREQGLVPCKWVTTAAFLREHGVTVEDHPEADTAESDIPGTLDESTLWAPRWAVLVAEAEPCNEEAKTQALTRARNDPSIAEALDAVARLAEADARRKMADFIMELWEPEGT